MRRLLTFLLLPILLACGDKEDGFDGFDAIPDAVFRDFCRTFDTNGNGRLSGSEIDAVTQINAPRLLEEIPAISTMKGVEMFVNLEYLSCRGNDLRSLDLSKNPKLVYLNCAGNNLSELDVSANTSLATLLCGAQQNWTLTLTISPAQSALWESQKDLASNSKVVLAE